MHFFITIYHYNKETREQEQLFIFFFYSLICVGLSAIDIFKQFLLCKLLNDFVLSYAKSKCQMGRFRYHLFCAFYWYRWDDHLRSEESRKHSYREQWSILSQLKVIIFISHKILDFLVLIFSDRITMWFCYFIFLHLNSTRKMLQQVGLFLHYPGETSMVVKDRIRSNMTIYDDLHVIVLRSYISVSVYGVRNVRPG